MPALLIYLVKVNIALLVFCLGYYAVLRHLTFYTLNRVYLVTAILFSTLYPLINVTAFVNRHQEIARPIQVVVVNWQVPAQAIAVAVTHHDKWYWLQAAFWAGALILAARFVVQLSSLYRLHRQSEPVQLRHYSIRAIKGDINPFSFWRSIYINPDNHPPQELDAILEHEQIHVNEWHTLDILLGEISIIFYWFNPGIWLMKKAIRENIEFITDRKILQQGMDCKTYQYSLVNVNFGTQNNAIVNHFNISTIKKRIMMMNAKRSSNVNLTRYMFLVPAVVALLLVFSVSKAELHNAVKNSKHLITNIQKAVTKIDLPFKPAKQDTPARHPSVHVLGKLTYITTDSTKKRLTNGIVSGKKFRLNNQLYAMANPDTIRKENGKIKWSRTYTKNDTVFTVYSDQNNVVHKSVTTPYKPVFKDSKSDTPDRQHATLGMLLSKMDTNRLKNITKMRINGAPVSKGQLDSLLHKMQRFEVDKNGQPISKITLNGKSYSSGGSNLDSLLHKMESFEIAKNGNVNKNGQAISKIRLNGKDYSAGSSNIDSLLHVMEVREIGKDGAVTKPDRSMSVAIVMDNYTKANGDGMATQPAKIISGHPAAATTINVVTVPVNFNNKLIIIDGKEATPKDLKKLSLDQIAIVNPIIFSRFSPVRDTLLAKYGDKAKNGVVMITTKK